MKKGSKNSSTYVNSIIQDIQNHFVSEETLKYTSAKIERIYEFVDGAVIKYDWQDIPGPASVRKFNHKFTMLNPPKPNPRRLKSGVIKVINFPNDQRS